MRKFISNLKTISRSHYNGFIEHAVTRDKQEIEQLLIHLRQFYPDFPKTQTKDQTIFEAVWPGKAFKYQALTNLFYQANLLFEEYLALDVLLKSDFDRNYLILESLLGQNLNDLQFNKRLEKLSDFVDDQYPTGIYHYFNHFNLAFKKYYHPSTNKHRKKNQKYLQACVDKLDRFYFFAKSQLEYEALNMNRVAGWEIHFRETNNIKEGAGELRNVNDPFFFFWDDLASLAKQPDELKFQEQRQNFEENYKSLTPLHRISMLIALTSYKSNLLNAGLVEKSLNDLLSLFEFGRKHNILGETYDVDYALYLNMIQLALAFGKFELADEIYQGFNTRIPDSYKEEANNLARTLIQWKKGNFDKALSIIIRTQFKDTSMNITGRIVELICEYELGNFDQFDTQLRQFTEYIRTVKWAPIEKKGYRNFIRFARRIGQENERNKQLLKEIDKCELLFARSWLKEKAAL
ncbi:MAG: hypothetical protein AAF502_23530 [Bacteroidota bacterium]